MSDQTPNSTEDLNGSEPSMEDILASIRKIISEDEPVALESPEDTAVSDIVTSEFGNAPSKFVSDAVVDAQLESGVEAPVVDTGSTDTGSVDLNIDDVLAGLDEDLIPEESAAIADAEADEVSDVAVESDASVVNDFESDEDILAFLDSDTLLDAGPGGSTSGEDLEAVEDFVLPSSQIQTDTVDFASPETIVANDDAEMDALLDEILMTPKDHAMDIVPEADVETPDSLDLDSPAEDLMVSEEESDLDLVKSLMADLADDPDGFAADEALAADDLDALLEIPELDETETVFEDMDAFGSPVEDTPLAAPELSEDLLAVGEGLASTDESVGEDEDILGDILDMTLEDELESHADDIDLDALTSLDDVTAAEQDNLIENSLDFGAIDDIIDETPEDLSVESSVELPSLSDIAAAAEADAVAVETGVMTEQIMAAATTAAVGAGAVALGAKVIDQDADMAEAVYVETEVETDTDDIDSKIDTFIDKISAESSAVETKPETSQSLTHQETSMPVKAVKTDAILDEVTEAATAGAFAELNTVVEDKAIFNERGPRIGDLVQDALRPMLKEWLDANLKGIVERAVTKEVKRISSGK